MKKENITKILLGILASLASFLLYGFIDLSIQVSTMDARLSQSESELKNLWRKYNKAMDKEKDYIIEAGEIKERVKILEVKFEK